MGPVFVTDINELLNERETELRAQASNDGAASPPANKPSIARGSQGIGGIDAHLSRTENADNAKSLSKQETQSSISRPALCKAQRIVGTAMGGCLAMWFAPFVSGVACNVAEKKMVQLLLSVLDSDTSDDAASNLFWFVRKKLFALNVATYIPFAGTGFQLLEVYALGQFTIRCATHYSGITDGEHLAASWRAIEEQIFSGDRVVSSYEEFTGNKFPEAIKDKFIPMVNVMRDTYRQAERVPGVMLGQEIAGEIMRIGATVGAKVLKGLWKMAMGAGG
jgi:hypothetical protein